MKLKLSAESNALLSDSLPLTATENCKNSRQIRKEAYLAKINDVNIAFMSFKTFFLNKIISLFLTGFLIDIRNLDTDKSRCYKSKLL